MILQPDEETLARYRHEAEEIRQPGRRSLEAAPRPAGGNAPTACASSCWATSSFPTRSSTASIAGPTASGCTAPSSSTSAAEREPDEEVHFQAYSQVVQAMGDRPVTIRTFDLGADKVPNLPDPEDERNPFLGLRQHPFVAAQLADVPHAVARRPAGQRAGQRAGHVPLDLHACWSSARRRWCWPT